MARTVAHQRRGTGHLSAAITLVGMNAAARPAPTEMAHFYQKYVDRCAANDLFETLEGSWDLVSELLKRIPEELGDHRYAPGKWSIKDVLQHCIDVERVMAYRALRFARKDTTPLPGFEEDDYAKETTAEKRSVKDLAAELGSVHDSTMRLFRSFSKDMLLRQGTANGQPCSVRALGWIIAGHYVHHVSIINERYLQHADA